MSYETEKDLRDFKKASAKLMREIGGDPEKARAYLLKAGFLEKHAGSKHGVRLAKAYRPTASSDAE